MKIISLIVYQEFLSLTLNFERFGCVYLDFWVSFFWSEMNSGSNNVVLVWLADIAFLPCYCLIGWFSFTWCGLIGWFSFPSLLLWFLLSWLLFYICLQVSELDSPCLLLLWSLLNFLGSQTTGFLMPFCNLSYVCFIFFYTISLFILVIDEFMIFSAYTIF